MKTDKLTVVRNWILDRIESGEVPGGGKLPTTREISAATDVSLLLVQSAVESLSNEGVLYKIPRHGVYVQPEWRERVLQRNLFFFDSLFELPYRKHLTRMLAKDFPNLRAVSGFENGMFEFRTTIHLQSHHVEYADLTEIFRTAFPDRREFFPQPFEACVMNGRMVGLPIIFSPRVMFYNPQLLAKVGRPEPKPGWTWDDFQETLACFQGDVAPEHLFFWTPEPFVWMNFILRAGGNLIDPNKEDPVEIDSPGTRRALGILRNFLRRHNIPSYKKYDYWEPFLQGKVPFIMQPREFVALLDGNGVKDWKTAPLPRIPGGRDTSVQATDILCVRRECADLHTAAELVKLVLGKKFQNYLGQLRYGIPIRRNAAEASIDRNNPSDLLFLTEMADMTTSYHLSDSSLFELVVTGINRIIDADDDICAATAELAAMTRTFLKLKDAQEAASPNLLQAR